MNRIVFGAMVPLAAASLVAGCGGNQDKSDANAALAANAATPTAPPGDCNPGKGIRVGETVAVKLAGNLAGTLPPQQLRWDTSGAFVTLVATGAQGSGKEVELVASTPAGPSNPGADQCLRSGNYVRFASAKHNAPDRYLQAFQGTDPSHVTIGNYPDPTANSNFFVLKVSGAPGSVIERGDEVTIRGTQHDPWLAVGDNPVAGMPVGLVHHPESDDPQPDVAKWTFGNKGEGN